jgi:glycosyltransferase involved in cell wall biosynthesis
VAQEGGMTNRDMKGGGRVLIVTDAWHPQVNGVVRTLSKLAEVLAEMGVEATLLTPERFRSVAMPLYPDIRLALATPRQVARQIAETAPDFIHIATEGPLGQLARRACLRQGLAFTTSYHTKFPEYLSARLPIPESWTYARLRDFHNSGRGCMVATASLGEDLARRGFRNIRQWTRGVDAGMFSPDKRGKLDLPGPIFLCVGRVAVEKNLPAFLDLDLPGSKVVVGDGPELAALKKRYPAAHFLGALPNEELARVYASCDVFVFPSRTDTFGNVLLEAMASGCPVAAYPVTGPIDIVGRGGVVAEDLRDAAIRALEVSREAARANALTYSWPACTRQFLSHLRPARGQAGAADFSEFAAAMT